MTQFILFDLDMGKQPKTIEEKKELIEASFCPPHFSFDAKDVVALESIQYRDSPSHYGCKVWIRGKNDPLSFFRISVVEMSTLLGLN